MKKPSLALQMIVVTTSLALLSGLILAFVWTSSADKIKVNENKKVEEALFELIPSTYKYNIVYKGDETLYKCKDVSGNIIAYFFIANGNGFANNIKTAIAVDPNWRNIKGIRILEQSETPGIGNNITKEDFLYQFRDLILMEQKPITYSKKSSNPANSEIKAITGATISSRAVVNLVNKKISILKKRFVQ